MSPRPETLVLSRSDVESLIDWDDVLNAVEESLIALAGADARSFPTLRERVPDGMVGVRGASWPARGLVGVKVSGFFTANRRNGLDSHQAIVVLQDPASGETRALVDGNHVTWMRTAIAGLAGTRALASADARRVLVVGNGLQAEAQVRSHAWGLGARGPEFAVHAPRDDGAGTKASAFATRLAERGILVSPAPDLERALATADIVVTATPSTEPILPAGWVHPGSHITAMGADASGKRELDDALVASSRFVADDREQSVRFGEGQALGGAASGGVPTLGDVLAGATAAREDPADITVFDSTGLGLHDVVTAEVAVRRALERGVGSRIAL
jgi:ornithine cyclodeaminase/alanine dehydrogenase-like protein (mu-crystallin family)